MIERVVDVAIIGGGPAGLAAAVSAKEAGANVLIVERNDSLGGILNQCIHEGFGLEIFGTVLTGPEYMQRYIDKVDELKIPYMLNSMVLDLSPEKVLTVSGRDGLQKIKAKAVVLAMGCRERTRGQICIPGTRPAGVYTAGAAQNFINLRGYAVGKKVVILGSGDIGLIMARRLTWEGAEVLAVVEIMPYSNGLPRNMQQCLYDFNVPLYLKHTITEVHGKKRVEAVTIAEVDSTWKTVPGSDKKIECDTLLLSVGLIPENELSKNAGVELDEVTGGAKVDEDLATSVEGIYSCGNVLHVHDLVDYVTMESQRAGKSAAEYASGKKRKEAGIEVKAGQGVRYVLPKRISGEKDVTFSLRVCAPEKNRTVVLRSGDKIIKKKKEKKLNPAEMISFTVKKEELSGCNELTVVIEDGA